MVWWGTSLRYETEGRIKGDGGEVMHEKKHWMSFKFEIQNGGEGGDFGVVRLQTCLTEILGFLEKFGGGYEQDIDDESEED
ncbi:hypothetical protein Tco_1352672 [Tanacetum coccineum]